MRISFGHRLTLSPTGSANDNEIFRFQNYRINQEHDGFLFLPFGFSGLCANRSPDNIEASLVFPNSGLSRARLSWILSVAKIQLAMRGGPEKRSKPNHRG